MCAYMCMSAYTCVRACMYAHACMYARACMYAFFVFLQDSEQVIMIMMIAPMCVRQAERVGAVHTRNINKNKQ